MDTTKHHTAKSTKVSETSNGVKTAAGRFTVAIFILILQIAALLCLLIFASDAIPWLMPLVEVVAVIIAIYLTGSGKHLNGSSRASWIILILALPLFGIFMYFLTKKTNSLKKQRIRFQEIDKVVLPLLHQNEEDAKALSEIDPASAGVSHYLYNEAGYPIKKAANIKYYPDALSGFKDQLEDIKNAKDFIFMEYFIVEDAPFFRELVDLLEQKAKEGVEVRFMYDDVGSTKVIGREFTQEMNNRGIKTKIFNPVNFLLSFVINNRDHRKITVIDGKIGYTGGYNLAEEYFNYIERFGYWKDTGVRIEGPGVDNLTAIFMGCWNYNTKVPIEDNMSRFFGKALPVENTGAPSFVQAFGDSPVGEKRLGEDNYMNIANRSRKFLYITTPYLIITDEMVNSLSLAAKRGVDVRIITPAIPDKKMVFSITRSYYNILIRNNVKIYEFTPGFVHAKMFLSDDEVGAIGTVNLDFRSLYHHFENSAVIYNSPALLDMHRDFDDMFEKSELIIREPSFAVGFKECILRLLAPLL